MDGWTCIFLIACLISLTQCSIANNDNDRAVAEAKAQVQKSCNDLKQFALAASAPEPTCSK